MMLNCKHIIKADDLPKAIMMSAGPPACPWCEIERLEGKYDAYIAAANANVCDLNREIERLRALAQLALRGLHNDFEPDNQSAIYNRIKAALGDHQQRVSEPK